MKEALISIISSELSSVPAKTDLLRIASELIDFYEANRVRSTESFQRLLEKYHFETLPQFDIYPEYPHVTLFHGSGQFEFWPVIDYEGGVTGIDQEIGTIIEDPPLSTWLDDQEYPPALQDIVIHWNWELHTRIVFTWLSTVWQHIKGYDYGIVVKTLENNSTRQFIFNDLAWDNLSVFTYYNEKTKRLNRYFDKVLSVEEIYERVGRIGK